MRTVAALTIAILGVMIGSMEANQFNEIPGCRTTKLDLIFVVDGSSIEYEYNYRSVRQWIQNITSYFDVSPYTTRVAVVQSGNDPSTEFGFHDFRSTDEVLAAVNNIQFRSGTATTADVLRYANNHVTPYARAGASTVILVLSDGNIESTDDVYLEAKRLRDMGIPTFAIGAGDNMARHQNVDFLKSFASEPAKEHVFVVQSLRNAGTLERSVIRGICEHTVQECPTASHDLAFIIDGSSTIGYSNFEIVKNWMKRIVDAFDVGPDKTRISVIQYSSNVQEEICFNENLTKYQVLEKITQMELMIGDTHTGHALEYSLKRIFSENHGSRNNIPDVAIVMTDGKAQDHIHVANAARLVHDAGIEVYAMGVGNSYSMDEIKVIASDPDENHILHADNFEQIDLQRMGLIKRICQQSAPGCPNTAADIVFLVDNQVLNGRDRLQNVQAWMKSAVDHLEVGDYYSRIALVRYGDVPELLFGLNSHESTADVINAITRELTLRYVNPNHASATGVALDYVKRVIFGHALRNVPRFLVILTDGQSSDNFDPALERAKKAGIKVFSFGAGEVNYPRLEDLASAPAYVFHEENFDDIRRRIGSFTSALCDVSEPACSIQEIDLQFLVDSSENIRSEDFEKVKRWIRNVIRSFDIGKYTTRVGLAKYSSIVQNVFSLNSFNTRREIEHAVEMIKPMDGSPYAGRALDYISKYSFSTSSGSRNGAAKVLVVLSDGNSQDSIDEYVKKIHKAGVRVFALGAGRYTEREFLEQLATEPVLTHVTQSSSYDAINTVRKQLVGEICRETKSECPEAEMDLIFLVDGSTAVGPESFQTVKTWLVSFVSQFEIGEYNSKIGLIQYADEPRLEINLKNVADKETLMNAIVRIRHLSGRSNIGAALEYVKSQGFSEQTTRQNIPKVIIVLTNGKSNDEWIRPALQLMSDGVIMYAVGVGDIRHRELRSLVSSDDNVLHVRNIDSVPTIHSSLVRRVCQGVQYECRENATDIVMLIDGSFSVGYKHWEVVKSFMQNITRRFEIGPRAVQVGVVQYASHPRIEFQLNEHTNWYNLQKAIRNLQWMTGDTYTARALKFTKDRILTPSAGARPNVAKILFVVTDGEPQDNVDVYEAAAAIRAAGWRIFAIGVDQATLTELHVMSSKPELDHVFYADDFQSTRKLKGRLFRMICTEKAIDERPTGIPRDRDFDVWSTDNPVSSPRFTTVRRNDIRLLSTPNTDNPLTNIDVGRIVMGPGQLRDPVVPRIKSNKPDWSSRSESNNRRLRPRSPLPEPATCPDFLRENREVTSGWDYMKEMGIIRPQTTGKPKRSVLINRFDGEIERRLRVKIRTGSLKNRTSYNILANTEGIRQLSEDFTDFFDGSWRFVAIFRMHGATENARWSLLNITDEDNQGIFSVSFDGSSRTVTVQLADANSLTEVDVQPPDSRRLFDRRFHKLEVVRENSHVSVKLDCVEVGRARLRNFVEVAKSLKGTFVTSSTDEESDVRVDIQEMIFQCDASKKEECCELPGGLCGIPSPVRSQSTNVSSQCVCPPGPIGPPGRPGKALKRGMAGKPGPRGPPGKPGQIKKSTIRFVAKKVATAIMHDEIQKMYQTILDSIDDAGRISRKVLHAAMKRHTGRQKTTGSPDPAGEPQEDCEDDEMPCERIPESILNELN